MNMFNKAFFIIKEDITTVLKHCSNFKEKAVISCLYESDCRATEFLDWRIGDIVFDKRGAVLNVKDSTISIVGMVQVVQ